MSTPCNKTLACGCRTDGAVTCHEYYEMEKEAIALLDLYDRYQLEATWQAYCDLLDRLEEHRKELWQ